MAENPVIVPVELQVTDLTLDNIDIEQVNKDISARLSGIKQSVEGMFAGVDASKLNKSVTSALSSVEKSISTALAAQEKLDKAIVKSGESSDVYKEKVARLTTAQSELNDLASQKALWEDSSGNFKGGDVEAYVKVVTQYQAKLKEVRALEAEAQPAQFALVGADEQVMKLALAYRNVVAATAKVEEQVNNLNSTVEQNKMTEEYAQTQAEANRLKSKLEELNDKSKKLAEVGATEKQWSSLQYDTQQVSSELGSVLSKMRGMVKEGQALGFDAAEEDVKKLKSEIKSINATRINIAGSKNKTGTVEARATANTTPYTADYQTQLKELQALEKKADSLIQKYERMRAVGGVSPKGLKTAQYDVEMLRGKLDTTRNSLTNMVKSGQAFKIGRGNVQAELSGINSRIDGTKTKLMEVVTKGNGVKGAISGFVMKIKESSPAFAKAASGAGRVATAVAKVVSVGAKIAKTLGKGLKVAATAAVKLARGLVKVVSKLGQIIGKAASAVKNMKLFGKSGNKTTSDMAKGFKKLQKNILMFGLGFRSAYYLIKRLRQTFVAAFKTLATQSDEVNADISSLVMTFNRLKGSLATAFQPLATVVIPILNTLMDKVSDAMEVIGKFFATLTGQNYIYKAVANQVDYAASLEDTGSAAEETSEKLGAYDKLDVISQDKDSSSSDGGNSGLLDVTYEKADAEGAASDFANMVKEAWKNADFSEVGTYIHDKLVGLLDNVKTKIIPKVSNFANTLASSITTFLEGLNLSSIGSKVAGVVNTLLKSLDAKKIGQALASIKSAFWQFASGLVNDIDWNQVGLTIAGFIEGFIDKLDVNAIISTITGLLNGIGTALTSLAENVDWAAVGTKFGTAIMNLFTNLDFVSIGTGIANFMNALGTAFLNLLQQIDFGQAAQALCDGINAMISGIDGATFNDVLSNLIEGIATFAATLVTNIDWTAIYEALKNGLSTLLTSLSTALQNSDSPVLQTVGQLIGSIKEALDALWPAIESIVQALGPVIQAILPILSSLLPPIAQLIAQAAQMILPLITAAIQIIAPILEQVTAMVLPILQELMTALQPVFEVLVTTVLPVISSLLNAIMPVISSILNLTMAIISPLVKLLEPLLTLVAAILEPVIAILEPILDVLAILIDLIADLLEPILDLITPLLDILIQILTPGLELLSLLGNLVKILIVPVLKLVSGVITGVIQTALKLLMALLESVAGVFKFFGDIVRSVFDGVKKAFQSVWDFIKGIINGILGGIEGLVNGVINGLNWMVRALNKLSFDVPEWVPVIGGQKFGFNLREISKVSIPRLAQGAVIPPNKEFLAVLGDQKSGTNIEAPLDTIKQALAEVMAEFGGGNHAPIILQLDGKTVAKVVWAEEEKRYKQTGRSAVYSG